MTGDCTAGPEQRTTDDRPRQTSPGPAAGGDGQASGPAAGSRHPSRWPGALLVVRMQGAFWEELVACGSTWVLPRPLGRTLWEQSGPAWGGGFTVVLAACHHSHARPRVELASRRVQLLATPWTIACQASLSMGFSILEWVAISSSWGSSRLRDRTGVS